MYIGGINMKLIGVSFGHNDKYNVGASGIFFEDKINKEVGELLINKINNGGKCKAVRLYKENVISYEDSIYYRPNMANQLGCDIAIDIHHNSFNTSNANGCEALGTGQQSELLANFILNEVQKLGYYNRGFKYNNYAFNTITVMPSIIYEGFFITNKADCLLYNAEKESRAIMQGIYNYLKLGSIETIIEDSKYTVVKGDTLTSIAFKLGVSVDHLVNINKINNPNLIYPGQILIYNKNNNNYNLYEVKEGDSLWAISKKLNIDIDNLIKINGITNPDIIFPNQILKY